MSAYASSFATTTSHHGFYRGKGYRLQLLLIRSTYTADYELCVVVDIGVRYEVQIFSGFGLNRSLDSCLIQVVQVIPNMITIEEI